MYNEDMKIYMRILCRGNYQLSDINHLRVEDFDINSIAKSLSQICRFAGNLPEFYSVAQHCVLVSKLLDAHGPEIALSGLLHDASEAFVTDLPSPIKTLMPDYIALETRIQKQIAEKFGLPWPFSWLVKPADQVAVVCEQISLQGCLDIGGYVRDYGRVVPVSAIEAEIMFLLRYLYLIKQLLRD